MPLPVDVLRIRIKNEVEMCQRELRHHISVSDPTLSSFPISINVTFMRVPGPDWEEGKVVHRFVHRMALLITEDYPVEKPIVKWQTPIFHPNIMPPKDGGYVCTKLLENWDFSSTLVIFIKGIESLLANPNPRSPFGNDTCTRAAAYFNRNMWKRLASILFPRLQSRGIGGSAQTPFPFYSRSTFLPQTGHHESIGLMLAPQYAQNPTVSEGTLDAGMDIVLLPLLAKPCKKRATPTVAIMNPTTAPVMFD